MVTECKVCGNSKVENQTLELCASCSSRNRKFERGSKKLDSKNQKKAAYKIPKISEGLKAAMIDYVKAKREHLKEHPDCQIKLIGCQNNRPTNTVHHCAKRGKNLSKKEYFKTACQWCHDHTEFVLSAKTRREKGLLITPQP